MTGAHGLDGVLDRTNGFVNLCTTFAPGQTATTFYEYLAKQLASLTTV